MYISNVSLLEVRKKPKDPSKIIIKRGTAIKIVGPPITCNHEVWIHIQTIENPIIDGYVLKKYIIKI